jgi:hypothetical protein
MAEQSSLGVKVRVLQNDLETKQQSMQWKSSGLPCSKKAQMSKSKVKAMLIYFFGCKGMQFQEFVPPGQTVNRKFNLRLLEHLIERVRRMRP